MGACGPVAVYCTHVAADASKFILECNPQFQLNLIGRWRQGGDFLLDPLRFLLFDDPRSFCYRSLLTRDTIGFFSCNTCIFCSLGFGKSFRQLCLSSSLLKESGLLLLCDARLFCCCRTRIFGCDLIQLSLGEVGIEPDWILRKEGFPTVTGSKLER